MDEHKVNENKDYRAIDLIIMFIYKLLFNYLQINFPISAINPPFSSPISLITPPTISLIILLPISPKASHRSDSPIFPPLSQSSHRSDSPVFLPSPVVCQSASLKFDLLSVHPIYHPALNSFFHLELQITPLDSPIVLFPDISL
jgi:hypothetical protein